ALVLVGGDELVRQARAFDFAHLSLLEQTRVLVLARREIRQDGRADEVVTVERTLACQPYRRDLFLTRLQRDDDRVFRRGATRTLARTQCARVRLEELLGLDARLVQHVVGGRDRRHRVDERLEELRFAGQLLLRRLVAAPLRDDQVRREESTQRDRAGEPCPRDDRIARGQSDNRDNRRDAEEHGEQTGSSR